MINKLFKSSLIGVLAIGLLLTPAAAPVQAQTSANLQAQIAALLAQVAALQAQMQGTATTAAFTRDLTIGSTGTDVTQLQAWLLARGHTIPAGATGYFGVQTRTALAAYQAAQGIAPAAGYFGPLTRARVNATIGTPTPNNPSPTPDDDDDRDLEGGAGSIDSYDLISSLNNEEVGEDEEDVEVAGLDIEVDDGSDIEIRAVRIAFNEGTADEDFEDYASEVSLWLDGEEFARIDADEFDDRNDWTRTISLDRGAIIRSGDTGELVVAITGQNNIDSNDIGDTWTVDFEQIRFMDADGATITDNPNTAARTFSFESFATAADVELRISEGDDDINDSRSIEIDESDETDDVELMSFEIEAEGDSDIELKGFGVNLEASTGSSTDMIADLRLVIDGEEYSGEYVTGAADGDNWVFDDVDFVIDAGDTVEAMIVADINGSDDFAEGATLTVSFSSDEENLVDAEDESGEDLGANDITGSANAGPFVFGASGIIVEAVSTDADSNDAQTVGTFKVVFDVTAFGDDQYIYRGADNASSSSAGVVYTVYQNGEEITTGITLGDLLTSRATTVGGDYFRVREGRTERFTLTVTVDPGAGEGGLYTVELDAVRFDPQNSDDDSAIDDTTYNVPSSEDTETPAENLVEG